MTSSRFTFILSVFSFLSSQTFGQADNRQAWKLLLDNKPLEARDIFKKKFGDKDAKVAGEALRGYGIVARFLGDNTLEMKSVLQAFEKDQDTLALMAGQVRHLNYGDSWNAFQVNEVQQIGFQAAKKPSQLMMPMVFELVRRVMNDGDISKADKLISNTGVVRAWWAIGPFANISGSGFDKIYPPETTIELGKSFEGKNGDKVQWFPINLSSPSTWILQSNHIPSGNAVAYYASQVESPVDRKANLCFGASGSFKVFLNDKLVLAEKVFRNTGVDAFIQQVDLHKGPNRILLKLGNEDHYSNFLLRFADENGRGIPDLKNTKPEGPYPHEKGSYPFLKNMPSFNREMSYLKARLARDSTDEDAALLAMDLYNVHEMTDSGEVWALNRLRSHPQSALWFSLLSESLVRSRQTTRAQEFAKSAYQKSPYCWLGWNIELNRLSTSAGPEAVMDFLAKSPVEFRDRKHSIMISMGKLGQLGRRDEAMKAFSRIETDPEFDEEVAALLAIVYTNQGKKAEAIKAWKKFLDHSHLNYSAYQGLSDLYLKSGDWTDATDLLREGMKYLPNNPNLELILSNIYLQQKKYEDAEKYLAGGLALAPFSPILLGLKGTLQSLRGDKAGAQAVLRQSVESNYNDFPSWDKLLKMEGRASFESLAPLPNLDSLIKAAKGWDGLKREKGAILTYIEDVFAYPSHAIRHRAFLVMHLPTQEAVNTWKQYSIPYNPSYQILGITRAVSHKASGSEVDAEVVGHSLVFKSLEPGDCIAIEWTLKDDYDGEMARQVWGWFDFKLGLPVFDSRLRLYMAGEDTIGYTIRGEGVKRETMDQIGMRARLFSRGPYAPPITEQYLPVNDETNPDVLYTTFKDWSKITDWYSNLVENKMASAPILRQVADSLFSGTVSDSDKVARVHRYVISNIAYSSLPFRQSGWIPQSSQEVLASRLGDCKDMAALAKSLLNLAGVESQLVLVATRDQFGTRPGPIGPHFNHCILSVHLGGKEKFIDLTDPYLHWSHLPKGDQGAVALVIKRGNNELTHLPVDSFGERRINRVLSTTLNDSGSAAIHATTSRAGIFARGQRDGFRFLSPEERNQAMLRSLSGDYADVVLDSLWFGNLEPTEDSIKYGYIFRGRQAVKMAGTTRIFALYMPDKISNNEIPDDKPRPSGIDLYGSWFSLGSFNTTGNVSFPSLWKLLNRPSPVHLKSAYGEYTLAFSLKGNMLTYSRKATFNLGNEVPAKDVLAVRNFLNQIAKNDDVQLVFTEKGK